MKKVVSIFLVLCILILSFNHVFADENSVKASFRAKAKISEENALKTAKFFLENGMGIVVDGKNYEAVVDIMEEKGHGLCWQFCIKRVGRINIMATIDVSAENGRVLRASSTQQPDSERLSDEEGNKEIWRILQKVNNKDIKELKEIEELGNCNKDSVMKYYSRNIDGIEYGSNCVVIALDKNNKKIFFYASVWDDNIDFPSKEAKINLEEAEKLISDNIIMKPVYKLKPSYGNYAEGSYLKVLYEPYYLYGNYIDAKASEISKVYIKDKKFKTIDLSEKEKVLFNLKAKDNNGKKLEERDAKEVLEKLNNEFYGGNLKIADLNKNPDMDFFSSQMMDKDDYIDQVSINVSSGEIMNYTTNKFNTEEVKVTYEEAYKKAIKVIEELYPAKIGHIQTKQIRDEEYGYYNFNFCRMENGAEYEQNKITIKIDRKSGFVFWLSLAWDDKCVFPKLLDLIPQEAAKDIYLSINKTSLQYVNIKENFFDKNDVRLVYKADSKLPLYVDAFSGDSYEYESYNGYENNNKFMEKISNSAYIKEINYLNYYDILDRETFDKTKKATRLEVLKMLVNFKGYKPYSIDSGETLAFKNIKKDSSEYKYLQLAVMYGILQNGNVDLKLQESITKEELCEYLVSCTSYGRIGGVSGLVNLKAKDIKKITPNRIGYVGLAKALKLLDIKDEVKPKETVTMEDVAVSIYKLMNLK